MGPSRSWPAARDAFLAPRARAINVPMDGSAGRTDVVVTGIPPWDPRARPLSAQLGGGPRSTVQHNRAVRKRRGRGIEPAGPADGPDLASEQLGLRRLEFGVAQDALGLE